MEALDLRGLVPAPVTPFTRDGDVDHAAIQRLGSWLGSFDGVNVGGPPRPCWVPLPGACAAKKSK